MGKKMKYHLYRENTESDETACGRDGSKAGLITVFFKMVKVKDRCKTCNKALIKEPQND